MVQNVSVCKSFPYISITVLLKPLESYLIKKITREYLNTERTIQNWLQNRNRIHIWHAFMPFNAFETMVSGILWDYKYKKIFII